MILSQSISTSFKKYLKIYQIKKSKTEKFNNINERYYCIEDKNTKKIIGVDDYKIIESINGSIFNDNFQLKIRSFHNKENKTVYIIQNKQTKKYLYRKGIKTIDCSFEITNEISKINEHIDIQFLIIKLYREKILNQENNTILNNGPIEVVLTYANISDIKFERESVKLVSKKDIENGEIRYSLRSIFKNIPRMRKIFIVVPNEKINFLMDNEERKEKLFMLMIKN